MRHLLEFFNGKRVLVTGHTGFKGSWLTAWLLELGAEVAGIALAPDTSPALFDQLGLEGRMRHHIHDIRDADGLRTLVVEARPDVVFHLAAQPLVRASYADPVGTYAVNVMGTLHLMEALKGLEGPAAAVLVTTDKVYANREWEFGYRETDRLGGHDPYSSSKACCELAIHSFRQSYCGPGRPHPPLALASARAGNVIGGGDWARDRIVPDCMRHLAAGEPIRVRNPGATRPWQHVLDPLWGYLVLGASLYRGLEADAEARARLETSFNFGPHTEANRPVTDLVHEVLRHWEGEWIDASDPEAPHEAGLLHLQIDRADHRLGWKPVWDFETAVERTVAWYREAQLEAGSPDLHAFTLSQIRAFMEAL